jgi:hypothetical protein
MAPVLQQAKALMTPSGAHKVTSAGRGTGLGCQRPQPFKTPQMSLFLHICASDWGPTWWLLGLTPALLAVVKQLNMPLPMTLGRIFRADSIFESKLSLGDLTSVTWASLEVRNGTISG